jgi:hypothetical protein
MSHIGQMAMHHIAQTSRGEDNTLISSQPHLCLTREPVVSHRLPSIVREEIAGAFQDKLGVSMVPGGNHIGNLKIVDLITTHTPREPGYPNLQNFWVPKEKTRANT